MCGPQQAGLRNVDATPRKEDLLVFRITPALPNAEGIFLFAYAAVHCNLTDNALPLARCNSLRVLCRVYTQLFQLTSSNLLYRLTDVGLFGRPLCRLFACTAAERRVRGRPLPIALLIPTSPVHRPAAFGWYAVADIRGHG